MKMTFAPFDLVHVPHHFYCGLMKLGTQYILDVMHMDLFAGIAGDALLIHGRRDSRIGRSES